MDNNDNHLLDILRLINNLQNNAECIDKNNGCTRNILGLNDNIYNTRPVSFYLCNNNILTVDESTIFRIESLEGGCVTVRLLTQDENNNIISTNEFATINISCIAAIQCSNDINLSL